MGKPLTIDRFEGNDKEIAVLVDEDGECQDVPRSKLPENAKAGDVLTESFEIDVDATEAVEERDQGTSGGSQENRSRWRPQDLSWRLVVSALVLIAVLGLAGSPSHAQPAEPGRLTIDVLDIGQGDSILIRSPEGKSALIDAGTSSVVVDRLKNHAVKTIDLVAVTHHHTDHYGGTDDVIKAFDPRFFLATDSGHTTSMYIKLLRLVRDHKMTAIQPAPDQARRIDLGSVRLTVLPQPPIDDKEENDNSIGIRLEYGTFSMLMTGDSEEPAREFWKKTCPELLRATVLKLAHHGSHNGTDEEWLTLVQPELAVISCGVGNSYGHPHADALSLLEKFQIPVNRTDQEGNIRIMSDGKRWKVLTEKGKGSETAAAEPAERDDDVRVTADASSDGISKR